MPMRYRQAQGNKRLTCKINSFSASLPTGLSVSSSFPTTSSSGAHIPDKDLQRVFRYFDEDGDGNISPAELQRCVRNAGGELSAEEAVLAVRSSDADGDGMLGLEDFGRLMSGYDIDNETTRRRRRDDELREAFQMYEMDGSGYITPKSLKRMLSRLGDSPTIDKCKTMIRRFDINGDGLLSFDEFKIMMCS